MSALAQPNRMTEAEYLAFERASDTKHEYWGGVVYAMTGASRRHNLITVNTSSLLHRQRDCEVYASDMRVKITAATTFVYPDVAVVCGEPTFADDTFDTLTNPTVIIEVLLPSTEAYDRGVKFQHYRTLDSLQAYVLISQDKPRIEQFSRQDDGTWLLKEAASLEATLHLQALNCDLPLADVYEKVDFTTKAE